MLPRPIAQLIPLWFRIALVVIAALWLRTRFATDSVFIVRYVPTTAAPQRQSADLVLDDGRLRFMASAYTAIDPPALKTANSRLNKGWRWYANSHPVTDDQRRSTRGILGFDYYTIRYSSLGVRSGWYRGASIPLWFLPILLAATFVPRRVRAYRRRARGQCPNCGYDLRSTPGVCPECGSPASPAPTPHPLQT